MSAMNDNAFAYLRGQARSQVQRPESLPDLSAVEIRGLCHELEIHQVELKLQNDELRESQWKLEESLQKYCELFRSIPIGFATIDPAGRVVDCNPAGFELLNITQGTSFTISQFLAVHDADRFALLCRSVLSTKRPGQCEMPLVKSDQSHIMLRIDCFPVTPADEQRLGIAFQDITGLVEADKTLRSNQAELQLLTRRLFDAQEEEREKLARHLHDNYAQRVQGMIAETQSLGTCVKNDHETHGLAMRLETGLKALLEDLRFMGQTIEPLDLRLQPLTRVMRNYVDQFSRQTGLKTKLRAATILDRLSYDCRMHLFRALQESLLNVARHAHASHVSISCSQRGNLMHLAITDDGEGFDLKSVLRQRKGMGLISMQERVRQMAGRIAIESSSSQGTSIQISISLDACMNGRGQPAGVRAA